MKAVVKNSCCREVWLKALVSSQKKLLHCGKQVMLGFENGIFLETPPTGSNRWKRVIPSSTWHASDLFDHFPPQQLTLSPAYAHTARVSPNAEMADLERNDQFGFLYENRDPCNAIALLQLGVTLISFFFTYTVWWSGLFGVIVAAMGYYGSVQPVIQSKVSFIQFYYFGNCFMLLLQAISAVVLFILVSEWKDFDAWAWGVIIFGTLSFGVQLFVTYVAIQRSHAYRAELMRNPPPAENVYGGTSNGTVYTAMGAGYKAPMAQIKTI
ncbi:hypothetical protein PC115_g6785 [Phytophthora cactorum]|uniref:Transmembrane protein n=3 Tax=Phytophthora cactorum TaxID=29920 RepID=A0A8T1CU57_9STRA|nr:hypothetical protein PC115_g6785 [Phytophthora cactorum]